MIYNRKAILTDTLSAIASRVPSSDNILAMWEEQMERLFGHPYRITGPWRKRFLVDTEAFKRRCQEVGADPFRVIFAIYAHARWMRKHQHARYKPFPTQLNRPGIFDWWREWEKHELILAGGDRGELVVQTALSTSRDQRPLRFRKERKFSSPGLRNLLVRGMQRLTEYRVKYPRLTVPFLLESYAEALPRVLRWALGDDRIRLSEQEMKFLDSLSERQFLLVQLKVIFPDHVLPDHRT